jgi:hypothetical protein
MFFGGSMKYIIRALKLNLGINGETFDYDGYVPDGIFEAFFINPVVILLLCIYFQVSGHDTSLYIIFGLLYVYIMGFFGFPMIKCYLKIEFPSGDGFYLYKRQN